MPSLVEQGSLSLHSSSSVVSDLLLKKKEKKKIFIFWEFAPLEVICAERPSSTTPDYEEGDCVSRLMKCYLSVCGCVCVIREMWVESPAEGFCAVSAEVKRIRIPDCLRSAHLRGIHSSFCFLFGFYCITCCFLSNLHVWRVKIAAVVIKIHDQLICSGVVNSEETNDRNIL